jgi:hypothetical protein
VQRAEWSEKLMQEKIEKAIMAALLVETQQRVEANEIVELLST